MTSFLPSPRKTGFNLVLVIALHACLIWLQPVCAAPKQAKMFFGVAEGNYLAGDLTGAKKMLSEILNKTPDFVPAIALQARIAFDEGLVNEALTLIDTAIALDEASLPHLLFKATILARLDRIEEARAIGESVVAQTSPTSEEAAQAQQLLGLLDLEAGAYQAAGDRFLEAAQGATASRTFSQSLAVDAYLETAALSVSDQNIDSALKSIKKAASVYAGDRDAASIQKMRQLDLMRARLLLQSGRREQAIDSLQEILRIDPGAESATLLLCSLFAADEEWARVKPMLERIEANPNLQDVALYFRGRIAFDEGRIGRARAYFEKALGVKGVPSEKLRPSLLFYEGMCLARLKRIEESYDRFAKALDLGFQPETVEAAHEAGAYLLATDQLDRAISLLEGLTLNRLAQSASIWTLLAKAHHKRDDKGLAISALNEAIKWNTDHGEARFLRGKLLEAIGDLEGALSDYKKALKIDQRFDGLNFSVGLIQARLGRIDEARASFKASVATKSGADYEAAWLLYCVFSYACQRHEDSRSALDAIADRFPNLQSDSLYYIAWLLKIENIDVFAPVDDPVTRFYSDTLSVKESIDQASIAIRKELAAKQICETAFWMSQKLIMMGDYRGARKLLSLSANLKDLESIEHHLARWQLHQLERGLF